MSRYTGPRLKIMRSLGVELPGLSRKSIEDRPNPPGQHGARQRRVSGYGAQLREKQKLRFNYGLGERQMRRLMADAKASRGSAGEKLAELLERRFDNVVFRAGFAPTIPAARQLVNHGHFHVNGCRVDIPSYRVRPGEVISLARPTKMLDITKFSIEAPSLTRPEWMSWDASANTATMTHIPALADVPFPIEIQLVVEYYAQRM